MIVICICTSLTLHYPVQRRLEGLDLVLVSVGIDGIGLTEQLVSQLIDRETGRVDVSGRSSRRFTQGIHFWRERGREEGTEGGRGGRGGRGRKEKREREREMASNSYYNPP